MDSPLNPLIATNKIKVLLPSRWPLFFFPIKPAAKRFLSPTSAARMQTAVWVFTKINTRLSLGRLLIYPADMNSHYCLISGQWCWCRPRTPQQSSVRQWWMFTLHHIWWPSVHLCNASGLANLDCRTLLFLSSTFLCITDNLSSAELLPRHTKTIRTNWRSKPTININPPKEHKAITASQKKALKDKTVPHSITHLNH